MRRIADAGFRLQSARAFESNTLVDTADGVLRQNGQILRLREYAGQAILTYKGASIPGKHKSREELETVVGSAAVLRQMLQRLGYEPTFRYEKYRAVYSRPGDPGLLTVDETPIGPFLELEGEADWIDQVADELGFGAEQYITESYGQLWFRHCKEKNLPLGNFVFATATPFNG